jgi:tyrosine-protein kinase Etk/Wzc
MENETLKSKAPMPGQQIAPGAEEEQGLAIGEIVAVVMEYRWLIAAITAVSILLGGAYLFVAKPVYKADGLLQVEEKSGGGMSAALKDLQPLLGDSTTVSAEQEILTSRMVLGRVINRLKLDIEVQPKTFPIIGGAIARRYKGSEPNSPLFGLDSYAWGGETLQVDALDVPRSAEDKPLILTVGDNGSFELFDEDGDPALKGAVGSRVTAGKFSIFVSNLVARPGTRFVLVRRSTESAVELCARTLPSRSAARSPASSKPASPARTRKRSASSSTTSSRPTCARTWSAAPPKPRTPSSSSKPSSPPSSARWTSPRPPTTITARPRLLDLNLETQSVLQSLVEVDNQIVALKQERDELRQNFTAEHPRVQAVDQRLQRLKERRGQFDADVNKLPDTQQKVLQLARDVEVSTTSTPTWSTPPSSSRCPRPAPWVTCASWTRPLSPVRLSA